MLIRVPASIGDGSDVEHAPMRKGEATAIARRSDFDIGDFITVSIWSAAAQAQETPADIFLAGWLFVYINIW
jgi:hypothetical protein